jgi:putative nucleotidyltransferase with HDIG domain
MKIIKSEMDIQDAYDLTLEAWAKALELRGREVSGHSRRVTELSVKLANRLGFDRDEIIQLRRGALLHDIGKMGVPEKILLKPGPLTEEELEVIWQHPLMGREIFKDIPYLAEALKVVSSHHEQVDGSGYPEQLLHDEIPITARVFSVVDNWDMLCSDRPYGKGWSKEETIAYLEKESGKKFDPMVVRELVALLGEEDRGGADGNG